MVSTSSCREFCHRAHALFAHLDQVSARHGAANAEAVAIQGGGQLFARITPLERADGEVRNEGNVAPQERR